MVWPDVVMWSHHVRCGTVHAEFPGITLQQCLGFASNRTRDTFLASVAFYQWLHNAHIIVSKGIRGERDNFQHQNKLELVRGTTRALVSLAGVAAGVGCTPTQVASDYHQ